MSKEVNEIMNLLIFPVGKMIFWEFPNFGGIS